MSAGESTEEIPTEDAITRLRTAFAKLHFALQGLWERSKRLAALIHGEEDRGPKDYDEDIADRVAREISRKYGRWHVELRNGDDAPKDNGDRRLLSWILGVLSALAVVVIAGGVTLYGEFTALKATVTTGMSAHEQRINRLEQERDRRAQPGAP